MSIIRSTAAVAAALSTTVALVACSSDDDGTDSADTTAASTASAAAGEKLAPAAVGDAIDEDNSTFTIHMNTTGAECDYGADGELPDKSKLVQIRAEVDGRNDSGWFVFDPADTVKEDGSRLPWTDDLKYGATGCVQADHSDDYVNWGEDIPAGQTTFVYGNFAVPEDAQYLNIRGHRFEIPDEEVDDVEAPAPASDEPAPQEAVPDSPASVDPAPENAAPDPETAQYWAEHPELGNGAIPAPNPMNPGTGDGYGPDVELPPFCARFPDHETCQ
jgi:hypothetical protein